MIIASALQRATSAEDWLKLGKYYHAHGLTDTAIEAYTYSLVLQPKPETRYLLGMANATLGNYDQANRGSLFNWKLRSCIMASGILATRLRQLCIG